MRSHSLLVAFAFSAGLFDIAFGQANGRLWTKQSLSSRQDNNNQDNGNQDNNNQDNNKQGGNNQGGNNQGGGNNQATCLNPNVIQNASADDGQSQNDKGVKAGQAKSDTDANNFINFCVGKTVTNGLQNTAGSCNGIPMGDIPATDKMVSTIITSPKFGDTIEPNKDFDVQLKVNNLIAGSFTNPDVTYYSAPQELDGGTIVGHVHVTVQDIGSDNPTDAPDATTTAFFKGIDEAGDGNGNLKASVVGGLPEGSFRICTMSSGSNHQPVIMPVAKRGAQDDCIRITVGQGGANGGQGNQMQGDQGGTAVKDTGDGAIVSYSSAAGASQPTGGASIGARKEGGHHFGFRHHRKSQSAPPFKPYAML